MEARGESFQSKRIAESDEQIPLIQTVKTRPRDEGPRLEDRNTATIVAQNRAYISALKRKREIFLSP
jgi:hypothetical protein